MAEDEEKTAGETAGETAAEILEMVGKNGQVTIPGLAATIGIAERSVERAIQKLQTDGMLRRIGPANGGGWEEVK